MASVKLVSGSLQIALITVSSLFFSAQAIPLGNWKSLAIIKELNRKGPYLGLITVYPPEEAFFATGAFKADSKYPYVDLSGRRFQIGEVEGRKVIYVRCGVGLVNAAAATQQILDVFDVVGILHFGISGNLNNSLSVGDVLIPKRFAQTGLWDWLNPNTTLIPPIDVAELDIGNYNVPEEGYNQLGHIGYRTEQFYAESGEPNTPQRTFWFQVTETWFESASNLEGLELQRCVNSSFCLRLMPKVVLGLNGTTSDSFINNAAYRNFLFSTFHVSSTDMESSAVVMTCLSNGFPILVIRGLSDLAGAQRGNNTIRLFGPLAATNVAKAVVRFVQTFSGGSYPLSV